MSSSIEESISVIQMAPRRRRPFRVPAVGAKRIDYCEVVAPSRRIRRNGRSRRTLRRELATVALTTAGVKFLDERTRALTLFVVLELAEGSGGAYPTTERFVGGSDGAVVALDSPQATPPPRRVGYWSDGTEHAAVVALSSAGRRLYVEVDTDDRISTNVLGYVTAF